MSKYVKGDWVRVTRQSSRFFDTIAPVVGIYGAGDDAIYRIRTASGVKIFERHELLLAIPPVEEVLSEMERESA